MRYQIFKHVIFSAALLTIVTVSADAQRRGRTTRGTTTNPKPDTTTQQQSVQQNTNPANVQKYNPYGNVPIEMAPQVGGFGDTSKPSLRLDAVTDKRMLKDLPTLVAVTKDEKFVTARHCMQSLWKVGIAGEAQRAILLDGLTARFKECAAEKNCTLIRYDIIESLRKIYDETADEKIRQRALDLIDTEEDIKYRKKYATLWKRQLRQYPVDQFPVNVR